MGHAWPRKINTSQPQQLSYRYAVADLPALEEALLRLAG